MTGRPRRWRIAAAGRLLVASLLATGVLLGGLTPGRGLTLDRGPAAALAATPGLTLVTSATYDVQPDRGRVAISVAITATNHLQDSITKDYVYGDAYLAVLPQTSGFRITTPGSGTPRVAVSRRTSSYTVLHLTFGSDLGAGASRAFNLTFNLVDPGGSPDRPIRISPSLVSFYAWAFATPSTPGSSVSVTFPAGYEVTVGRGPLAGPATDTEGRQTWTSGALQDPLAFVADVSADRPAAYLELQRAVAIGGIQAQLLIRSWPDDAAWRDRVSGLLTTALPVLGQAIGLAWPIATPLVVQESLPRSTGGYAGLFDPATDRIEIAYVAPTGVVLHEAAHAWFNGSLVADRWAAEAFASYYAEVAAATMKVKIDSPQLTPADLAAAIPLNAWGPVGSEPSETESYAYAASLVLARQIAARAGDDGLRRVWSLASQGIGAYQPPTGAPERLGSPPDWRALLDLLEDTTGRSYADLWQAWVVRPEDLPALAARAVARGAYAQGVADAGPWQLPPSIREAMRTWQFDEAERELSAAEGVLRQRTALEGEATADGLQLPVTLRREFETGDLVSAASEAAAELAALGAFQAARQARPSDVTTLDAIGLLGTDPDGSLREAAAAFSAGDLQGASHAAADATSAWTSAATVGRGRVMSAIALAVAIVLLAGLVLGRRRRSTALADGLHSRP
ncbi:MAG TPA: hypothetical protein VJ506_03460 [Candidatus Limnocylindrales bacterium]|nr:hypothetical protein [Candidatus Limnocylindrales bacterium]